MRRPSGYCRSASPSPPLPAPFRSLWPMTCMLLASATGGIGSACAGRAAAAGSTAAVQRMR